MKRIRLPAGARRFLFLPPLALGIAFVLYMKGSSTGPAEIEAVERRTPVRVVTARRTDVVPRALGYGVVRPGRVWRVAAQVSGRIVEKHPRAEAGGLLAAGTVLARIDPAPYELAVREAEAQLARQDAELSALETRESNTQRTLEVERRALDASKRELERKEELLADDVLSQSDVDQEESRYLAQLVRVQELENTLALVPSDRAQLEASRLSSLAKLDSARLDLSYTVIEVPYDVRLVRVEFDEAEYVGIGQGLAEGHGVDVAEIAAQVPIAKLRHLIPESPANSTSVDRLLAQNVVESFGLDATVRLRTGDLTTSWEARVDRVSGTIDPETRTLGVVVAVDRPYEAAIPGRRPPLVQDMFCEVEIRGRSKPDQVVLPRSAVHDGEVYVAEDGRLRRRAVTPELLLHDFVVFAGGIDDGETIVVSDPIPAIDGMWLEPSVDGDLEGRIASIARGEAPLK